MPVRDVGRSRPGRIAACAVSAVLVALACAGCRKGGAGGGSAGRGGREEDPLPLCNVMCPSVEPGVQFCVGCRRGDTMIGLSLDSVLDTVSNVRREVKESLWRTAGLDKRQLAGCVADTVPEAAHKNGGRRLPYLWVRAELDTRTDGSVALSTVTLDGGSHPDTRARWYSELWPVVTACLRKTMRAVRLAIPGRIEHAKFDLQVEVGASTAWEQ
jgi:hypothetical protein